MRKNYIQVITTTEKKEDAEKISNFIIEKKLAGCVQIIGPIMSTYRWKGKIEKSEEWLCIIKTKENLYKELEKTIKKLHSYETPEIIVTPIKKGSKEYLKWLNDSLRKL